jgi:hypothetical protein
MSNNSKTKKKSRIDTYETIYYVDLVVANQYTTLEELKKLYIYSDGVELDEQIMDTTASTSTIRRKSDGKDCILVKYNGYEGIKWIDKKTDLLSTITHEAGHVCINIYDHMIQNSCPCSQEPFCYLLGWVTECIYKTLKK